MLFSMIFFFHLYVEYSYVVYKEFFVGHFLVL